MVEIDFAPVFEMQKKLVDIKAGTPEALKKALNETAKEARKRMVAQAQESYSVKKGRFNKAAKIKSATSGRLTATITAKGEPLDLLDYKVSPSKPPHKPHPPAKKDKDSDEDENEKKPKPIKFKRRRKRKKGGSAAKARVYSTGGLKSLEKGDLKAFVNYFSYSKRHKRGPNKGELSGDTGYHFFVGQRKTKERLPIKTFYSNSIPKMLGSETKVRSKIEPGLMDYFYDSLATQMEKLIARTDRGETRETKKI